MHRFLKELPIDDSGDLDEFDDELQSDLDTSENELNVEKYQKVSQARRSLFDEDDMLQQNSSFYTPKNRPPLILKQKTVSEPS